MTAISGPSTTLDSSTILDAIERLDAMPTSVNRLLELAENQAAGMSDVAEIVRFDAVLSADVLRKANSPMYGARQAIVDATMAVGRLGLDDVLHMAMVRAMRGRMAEALPPYGFDRDGLWKHSLETSIAAECISHFSVEPTPNGAGTAALLHDIGKLVLADCVPRSTMMRIAQTAKETGRQIHELEVELLGLHHGQVGATVARAWGFPVSVQVAITGHHPPYPGDDLLSRIVRTANAMAHELDPFVENPNNSIAQTTADSILRCGVDIRRIGEMYELAVTTRDEVLASFN